MDLRYSLQQNDDDGWFSTGLDQQHQDHLDELAHTDDEAGDAAEDVR